MPEFAQFLEKNTTTYRGIHFFRAYEPGPFAERYYQIRKKEGRIYDDETLAKLPQIAKSHPLYAEWKKREETQRRLLRYLQSKPGQRQVLDIGCGNGWLSNRVAQLPDTEVLALDKVVPEMEQGARVFGENSSLFFCYGDLFHDLPKESFDLILMVASAQYFHDLSALVAHLRSLLKPEGEIHFLDTHFYEPGSVSAARARSMRYYTRLGYPELAEFYHSHSETQLLAKGARKLREPDGSWVKLKERMGMGVAVPFAWWVLNK